MTHLLQLVRGFAMGAADIVPGVSGGTVALVLGIYERLIANIHCGSQALKELLRGHRRRFADRLTDVEWGWLLTLLGGVVLAVASLSSILERLLADHPVPMAGLFFGLVVGSAIVAWRLIGKVGAKEAATMTLSAAALFALLGLRSETKVADGAVEIVNQPPWVFFLSGALAICAMILPGISGSFILVMIGMYTNVLGAVNDRDLISIAAFAVGCVVGLAIFSSLLTWLLDGWYGLVIAAMVGLLVGSLRVLWPWPDGTYSTELAAPGDPFAAPLAMAAIGFAVVVGVDRVATRSSSVR